MENKIKIFTLIAIILMLAVGGYFAYRYSVNKTNNQSDPALINDIQGQVQYAEASKAEVDQKPFINALPYQTKNYDIYYLGSDDQVEVYMKNVGKSFAESKAIDEPEVNKYFKSINLDPSKQTVVWYLQKN